MPQPKKPGPLEKKIEPFVSFSLEGRPWLALYRHEDWSNIVWSEDKLREHPAADHAFTGLITTSSLNDDIDQILQKNRKLLSSSPATMAGRHGSCRGMYIHCPHTVAEQMFRVVRGYFRTALQIIEVTNFLNREEK